MTLTRKQFLSSFLFWTAVCIAFFLLYTLNPSSNSPWFGTCSDLFECSGNSWFTIVHRHFNAVLIWHNGLFGFSDFTSTPVFQTIVSLGIFGLGFSWLLTMSGRNLINSLFLSGLLVLIHFFIIGYDSLLWGLLSGTLILSAAIYQSITTVSHEKRWKIISVCLSALVTHQSLYLACVPLLVSIMLALILKGKDHPNFPPLRGKHDLKFLLALFLPWIIITLFAPSPEFPDYSPLGHVVTDDGLPGNTLPSIGPMPPIPVIDKLTVEQSLYYLSLSLLLATWLLRMLRGGQLNNFLTLLTTLIALDVLAPSWLSQISPLAVLNRIVPWLFFYPITLLLLMLVSTLYFLSLCLSDTYSRRAAITFIVPVLLPFLLVDLPFTTSAGILYAGIEDPLKIQLESITDINHKKFAYKISQSPSYAVLKKTGLWPLSITDKIAHWQFSSLLREQPRISTNVAGDEPTSNMHDRNIGTRWSPGGGAQIGNEWVYAYLPEQQTIHGIELVTGPYHTDFARGVRISVGVICPRTVVKVSDVSEIMDIQAEIPKWEGSITVTEEGFPYFGGQGGGRIYFKEPIPAKCLLIEQTGKAKGFDWSIAELRTLKYPQ